MVNNYHHSSLPCNFKVSWSTGGAADLGATYFSSIFQRRENQILKIYDR